MCSLLCKKEVVISNLFKKNQIKNLVEIKSYTKRNIILSDRTIFKQWI